MNSSVSCGVLLGLRVAGPDLGAGRQDRPDLARRAAAGETPGLAATRIWSSLPSLSKSRCAVGEVEAGSVAPPIELDRAELDEPGDP